MIYSLQKAWDYFRTSSDVLASNIFRVPFGFINMPMLFWVLVILVWTVVCIGIQIYDS